jgi:hypothetical protein
MNGQGADIEGHSLYNYAEFESFLNLNTNGI